MWPFQRRTTIIGYLTVDQEYGPIVRPDKGEFWTVGLHPSKFAFVDRRVRVTGMKCGWHDLVVEKVVPLQSNSRAHLRDGG